MSGKKLPPPPTEIKCPECGGKAGLIAKRRWFCHDCGVEIFRAGGIERIYTITPKGNAHLVSMRGITQ